LDGFNVKDVNDPHRIQDDFPFATQFNFVGQILQLRIIAHSVPGQAHGANSRLLKHRIQRRRCQRPLEPDRQLFGFRAH
jgi:hypothetical protein